MKDLIHAFPDNIKEAIAIAEASDLKTPSNKIKNNLTHVKLNPDEAVFGKYSEI